MIITLDGTAASGKSTLAKVLAYKKGFFYIYSGLFYRALAFVLHKKEVNFSDESAVCPVIRDVLLTYSNDLFSNPVVFFLGKNITGDILKEDFGELASKVSSYKCVRSYVLKIQRDLARKHENIIADGRDCGTNVFRFADKKFFITASINVKIERMMLRSKDSFTASEVKKYIIERDKRDAGRKLNPMVPSKNAHIVDTSKMTIKQSVAKLLKIIESSD
jgi:CMP/dCMP kinase